MIAQENLYYLLINGEPKRVFPATTSQMEGATKRAAMSIRKIMNRAKQEGKADLVLIKNESGSSLLITKADVKKIKRIAEANNGVITARQTPGDSRGIYLS